MDVAHTKALSALLLAAVAGLTMFVSSAASASDRQEVSLTLSFVDLDGVTTTQSNGHVVQGDGGYFGTASGPSPLFGGEAGAEIRWTLNTAETRGALAGSFAITGNPFEINWFGTLHGRITPDGGSGTLSADAVVSPDSPFPFTAQRLTGTWTYDGVVDPTTGHTLVLSVTAIVTL